MVEAAQRDGRRFWKNVTNKSAARSAPRGMSAGGDYDLLGVVAIVFFRSGTSSLMSELNLAILKGSWTPELSLFRRPILSTEVFRPKGVAHGDPCFSTCADGP